MRRAERINGFVEAIWHWYATHKRRLPWRDLAIEDDHQRAYCILVSEIMLQQTQVERVKDAYRKFLADFPALQDLARASNRDVLMAWRGLGYNARALRLRDAARTIADAFGGIFPQDMEALQSIGGIGVYTAAAIRNFAFGIPTPCLDTNIRRILHRVFVGPENGDGTWKKDDAYLLGLAAEVLAVAMEFPRPHVFSQRGSAEGVKKRQTAAADWHAALMDFGSLVCTKTHPKWDVCPLAQRGLCKAAYRVRFEKAPTSRRPEPGREIGGKFTPNRIVRGRIVEELRNASAGLNVDELGARICADWSSVRHRAWLETLLSALRKERIIQQRRTQYSLAE